MGRGSGLRTERTAARQPGHGILPVLAVVVAFALMGVVAANAVLARMPDAATSGPEPDTAEAPADDTTGQGTDDAARPRPTGPVTLAFGGDVHFESWLGDAVRADPDGALAAMAPLFADADLAVVNLETAVTDGGQQAPKRYAFRAPAESVTALKAAGVDVVSLANNHGMDFGVPGLEDTLGTLDTAGLPAVGAGMTSAAAYRPYRTTVNGRRIAIIGATQVLDSFAIDAWNPTRDRPGLASAKDENNGVDRLLAAVRRAGRANHTVVVMLHWGEELRQCPLERQQTLAAELRAAGADVIVGGHAHRLGPGGFMDDAVVHYGLGNLVFYVSEGPGTISGALHVTIAVDDTPRIAWRPAVLAGGIATPVTGGERDAAVAAWDDLRSCTRLAAAPGAS